MILDLNKFFFEPTSWNKEFCFCVSHALSEHGSEPFHSHPFRSGRQHNLGLEGDSTFVDVTSTRFIL